MALAPAWHTRCTSSINVKNSRVIQKLICACVDDQRTLQHERKFVDVVRAETLTRLARERQQFVVDLERLGERAQHQSDGSWVGLLREAGRNVLVAAAGCNNDDAIATCCHSHSRTEARYDDAMRRPWPDETRRVLEAQRRRLHDESDELHQLQF
jgi:hypothetical protein